MPTVVAPVAAEFLTALEAALKDQVRDCVEWTGGKPGTIIHWLSATGGFDLDTGDR